MSKFLIAFFIIMFLFGCKSYPQIQIEQCNVLTDTALISAIKEEFKKANKDTLERLNFSIDYKGKGYRVTDEVNKWSNKYSDDYFDVIIKYVDQNNLILYCPRSGIISGYKIFGKKHHDIYLIDRKKGNVKVSFKSKDGILSSIIKNDTVYFELNDPYRIKFCSITTVK